MELTNKSSHAMEEFPNIGGNLFLKTGKLGKYCFNVNFAAKDAPCHFASPFSLPGKIGCQCVLYKFENKTDLEI